MTKKLALMFALLLVPSVALAQDDVAPAAQVESAVAVQEETPPSPEPVAADQAAPMVGQGCVNCGQATVVGTPISSGCGCGTVVSGCGCGSPSPCCGTSRPMLRTRTRGCCGATTACGCSTPAPSCGCSTPAPSCGCNDGCGSREGLFARLRSRRSSSSCCGGCSAPATSCCGSTYAAAPVTSDCGCGSTVAAAPVSYNQVQQVSYVASDCCQPTRRGLRPFNGTLLRRR